MAPRSTRSVLSLQGASFQEHQRSTAPTILDLELPHGQVTLVEVDDEDDATALVNLCVGLTDPRAGHVRFLGEDWRSRNPHERLGRRRRIGAVIKARVWPSHMTILDSVLMSHFYHFDRPHSEVMADATALARLFGLPGLPAGRRETTQTRALVRAACVRGFLGAPDLIVVQDRTVDETGELGVPMAQAIAAAQDRGAAILWITETAAAMAARFVQTDHVFRLGDQGLVRVRRLR